MNTIPTVKVKKDSEKSYRIINKADFVAGKHELYEAEPAEAVTVAEAPKPKGGRAKK